MEVTHSWKEIDTISQDDIDFLINFKHLELFKSKKLTKEDFDELINNGLPSYMNLKR